MAKRRGGNEEGACLHLAVDYAYLFGCRGGTIRHDPQVRFQLASTPVDLGSMVVLTQPRTKAK